MREAFERSGEGRVSRALLLGGVIGPLVFVAVWLIAGAITAGYSPLDDAISDLAAVGAPTRVLMTIGFVAFGVCLVAFGVALRASFEGPAWVAAMVTGASTLGVAATPLGGWSGDAVHAVFAGIGYASIVALPACASAPLRRAGRTRWVRVSLTTSVLAAVCLIASAVGPVHGLWQRLGLTVADAWIVLFALQVSRDQGVGYHPSAGRREKEMVPLDRLDVPSLDDHDVDEVHLVARGIATAVAPEGGLTAVQADLLQAIASALTGVSVDYRTLEPLGPDELAAVLASRDLVYRQRIVHHMVLGELVLRPIPTAVAFRVAQYAQALGVQDDFVRVARRYAEGAYGLAWKDLQRNGFVEHVRDAADGEPEARPSVARRGSAPFDPAELDPTLAARWAAFEDLPENSLGRAVWDLYDGRGFVFPGAPGGASAYLAQHDFVHVLADYGTNLKGEVEVFAFIGRADPDPKGFAWLATLTGLFETGYIPTTGFFDRDVREPVIQTPGMHLRVADAIRRGKVVSDRYGVDLFEVDYHGLAHRSVAQVREMLGVPPKSSDSVAAGSVGPFVPEGMSEMQRRAVAHRRGEST